MIADFWRIVPLDHKLTFFDRPVSVRAPLAQLDRATGFEPVGRGFESLRAHQSQSLNGVLSMKSLVARALAKRVQDGDVIGIGSGSTVELALEHIAERIARDKLHVLGVPTSHRTALVAEHAGIRVLSPISRTPLAWAFDGADEVDPAFRMIKGRGAAMLNEKIIARRAAEFVIIVSEEKLVDRLGKIHPVPIEVIPEAIQIVEDGLMRLGARKVVLRAAANKYGPVITEHNNFVLDVTFDEIGPDLEQQVKSISGVVESGLFFDCATEVLVSRSSGIWSQRLANGKLTEVMLEPAVS